MNRIMAAMALASLVGLARIAEAEVILTRSLKLYEGDVSISETAVVIRTAAGPHIVPKTDAIFRGATRVDAYRELAKNALSLKGRLKLAQWCLDNELQAQAVEQCDQALKLSPGNAEATQLMTKAKSVGSQPVTATRPEPRRERPRGLPRDTVATYNQKVLPLLRNSCSAAGCHNQKSTNSFAIHHPVLRSDRSKTLDSILGQVDRLDPTRSRLIHYATTPHGGQNEAPLSGRYGPRQIELLTAWVTLAARQMDLPSEKERARREALLAAAREIEAEKNAE